MAGTRAVTWCLCNTFLRSSRYRFTADFCEIRVARRPPCCAEPSGWRHTGEKIGNHHSRGMRHVATGAAPPGSALAGRAIERRALPLDDLPDGGAAHPAWMAGAVVHG